MGLIFFCFFEKFFVPILTSGGLAAVSSSFFAALCSAFGRYDVVHIHAEGPAFFCWIPKLFGKRVISTIHGLDWAREKWKFGVGSKFIRQGEKNAVKYADEIIVLSKGVQKYFMETYGRSCRMCSSSLPVLDRWKIPGTFAEYEHIGYRCELDFGSDFCVLSAVSILLLPAGKQETCMVGI